MATRSPEFYSRIKKYEYVASPGSRFVCVDKRFGSCVYELRSEVYPPDQKLIPSDGPGGTINYTLNPDYDPQKK